ncbi:MAG: DUF169 domain-containing protein [Desulfobacterales bacterium]|nr:DUF169 domain-containing protein [Desulfobacterales bacterium]MCP4159758.1 DUF169 domain-containing protein [Deltaproteobacteria bacterium]
MMLKEKEMLEDIAFLRKPDSKKTLCQLITLIRNFDWTIGADSEDFFSLPALQL